MEQILNIYAHPDFAERSKLFIEKYDLTDIITAEDERYSKRKMKGYTQRICRFCGLAHPETMFSDYSHLVSQLMWNKQLYSDFECDNCNERFSHVEDELANFIGLSRSINGLQQTAKTKGFVAQRLSAKSRSFVGENILIIAPEDYTREGIKTTIRYIKNPFTPCSVYRALLKCALSLLSEKDTIQYQRAFDYLNGKFELTNGAFISGYQLSFQNVFPLHIYLFKKKTKNDKIPTDIVVFHFQNQIINFALPFHNEDLHFYNETVEVPYPPLHFANTTDMMQAVPMPYQRDLSSVEKITTEEEEISMVINTDTDNTVVIDTLTGELSSTVYNPNALKYLILVRGGAKFNPKAFSAFIKQFGAK